MQFLERIRHFCDLTRRDVEAGTGVSASHRTEFENGRRPLNDFEEAAVRSFLEARLKMIAEEEEISPDVAIAAREPLTGGVKREPQR